MTISEQQKAACRAEGAVAFAKAIQNASEQANTTKDVEASALKQGAALYSSGVGLDEYRACIRKLQAQQTPAAAATAASAAR